MFRYGHVGFSVLSCKWASFLGPVYQYLLETGDAIVR